MLDFTKLYGRLAHQSPRNELVPTTMPTLAEIDELISREGKMHESLIRIREMILAQQSVMTEQTHEPRIKGLAELGAEEDAKPFAANVNGSDPKRRKGVSITPHFIKAFIGYRWNKVDRFYRQSRELHHPVDVTAVAGQRLRNGVEVRMGRERYVMLAVYVSSELYLLGIPWMKNID